MRKSLSAAGTWVYERVELQGVESGAVHIKFRFQPVDTSLRMSTEHMLAGYAKKKTLPLRVAIPEEEAKKSSPTISMFYPFGRGSKGTKIKIKGRHGGAGEISSSSSDDEDENDATKGGYKIEEGPVLGDREYFDFGTDDEREDGDGGGDDAHARRPPAKLLQHALSAKSGTTPPPTMEQIMSQRSILRNFRRQNRERKKQQQLDLDKERERGKERESMDQRGVDNLAPATWQSEEAWEASSSKGAGESTTTEEKEVGTSGGPEGDVVGDAKPTEVVN